MVYKLSSVDVLLLAINNLLDLPQCLLGKLLWFFNLDLTISWLKVDLPLTQSTTAMSTQKKW